MFFFFLGEQNFDFFLFLGLAMRFYKQISIKLSQRLRNLHAPAGAKAPTASPNKKKKAKKAAAAASSAAAAAGSAGAEASPQPGSKNSVEISPKFFADVFFFFFFLVQERLTLQELQMRKILKKITHSANGSISQQRRL